MSPKTGFAIIAVLLIILGIIRFSRGRRTEGSAEIIGGIFELIFEVLGGLIEIIAEIISAA